MIRWLIFFLMFSSTAFCQQLLEGTIIDKETGKPVPFASVGIVGTSKGTSSNLNGQFSISINGPVQLQITSIGYESLKVYSIEVTSQILLKPIVTTLDNIVIFDKPINAKKIVKKAFANISKNYNDEPFLQNFFYRHYCKDDGAYGRLIEASVEVWKNKGYKLQQKSAGEKEEIRVTQLRRSLDKTELAQGHEPISVGNILQADLVGYQEPEKSEHMSFYATVSNLKADLESYTFTFNGITYYDGQEVYEINYIYKTDSVLTTSGKYRIRAQANGSLFITTDSYAFIKTEDVKSYGNNTIRTLAYYRSYMGQYYPYHFILDGENVNSDNSTHSFHIELMSVEIKKSEENKFSGHLPTREELLNIPYDSVYWTSSTILKTTPLEDEIIHDLGGGTSLNKQFYRYQQYEMNVHDGGKNGEKKFNWLKEDSKGNRILYLVFWSDNFVSYLAELELAKQLHQQYHNKITFVFLSTDDDDNRWQQIVQQYNFSTDGIINYRIGSNSQLTKSFKVNDTPAFILVSRNGEVFDSNAKRPSDPLLNDDFKFLIEQK
ncbi:MAG: carboxypeptidase-like regulatory domain-containing protein [Chryseolinea sp.]